LENIMFRFNSQSRRERPSVKERVDALVLVESLENRAMFSVAPISSAPPPLAPARPIDGVVARVTDSSTQPEGHASKTVTSTTFIKFKIDLGPIEAETGTTVTEVETVPSSGVTPAQDQTSGGDDDPYGTCDNSDGGDTSEGSSDDGGGADGGDDGTGDTGDSGGGGE
jgi:hypothetical protein